MIEKEVINILITDDHPTMREGFKALLKGESGFNIIGEAANGKELLDHPELNNADVILLDLEMPVMNGFEASKIIKTQNPETKILVFSMHNDYYTISKIFQIGVNGYVSKGVEYDELIQALRAVKKDGLYIKNLSKDMGKGNSKDFEQFTSRELETLRLICMQLTTQQISLQMNVSVKTVEGYREKLMRKTEAKNMIGLYAYALNNGIV